MTRHWHQAVSPLRQRMLDDMRMRKLERARPRPATFAPFASLTAFLKRSPDTATVEDLRSFQLHMVDARHLADHAQRHHHGLEVLLRRHARPRRADGQDAAGARAAHAARRAQPRGGRAPHRRGAATSSTRRRCRWPTARACAPARSLALKVSDIDSQRMTLRVEQGKGSKDRYAMLSPGAAGAAARLVARRPMPRARCCPTAGCSRAMNPIDPLTTRQLNRAIHEAAEAASIDKRVSMHTLRHSFATHLLERRSTSASSRCCWATRSWRPPSLYAQVATDLLREVVSPLETLQPA